MIIMLNVIGKNIKYYEHVTPDEMTTNGELLLVQWMYHEQRDLIITRIDY